MREEIKNMPVADYLRAARGRILNAAAMGAAYDNWGDDSARKEVHEAWADMPAFGDPWARRVTIEELRAMSDDILTDLGFGKWDDELCLIPLWAWNYIADGTTLVNIFGVERVKGRDEIDLDVRFGCVSVGFAA